MKRAFVHISAILLLSVLFSFSANAQSIYVKIFDENNAQLTGGVTMTGFTGQTEVAAFGQESSSCEGTSPSCIPVTGNFIFNLSADATITDFRRALYLRKVWRKVEISFTRSANAGTTVTYEKITLQDVNVTSINQSVTGGDGNSFQIKLDPVKISWAYTTFNANGTQGPTRTFNWDRSINAPF